MAGPVFISHSSRDVKVARDICDAIERRGMRCWISGRDVGPGDNFGDAIVDAIERAKVMVLVFSANANNSEEIKKEIALASQHRVAVIPVRVEDITPSNAFRYELATRQWIDMFVDWDQALKRLTDKIASIQEVAERDEAIPKPGLTPAPQPMPPPAPAPRRVNWLGPAAGVVALVAVASGAAFFWMRPSVPVGVAEDAKPAIHAALDAAPVPKAPPPPAVAPSQPAPPQQTNLDGGGQGPPGKVAPAPANSIAPPAPVPLPATTVAASPPPTMQPSGAPVGPSPQTGLQQASIGDSDRQPAPTPKLAPTPAPAAPAPPVAEAPPALSSAKPVVVAALSPTVPPSAASGVNAPAANAKTFKDCDACPEMVVAPRGAALIGSPAHEAARMPQEPTPSEAVIPAPFAVARYDVTFDEWDACVAEGGCNAWRPGDFNWGRGNQPVIFVSWKDTQGYVDWLVKKTGKPYRLLSETEWEYAARGCVTTGCPNQPFWFGTIKPELANYDSRYAYEGSPKGLARRRAVPVDEGAPNPFGLYNMLGNVRQWVEDCWSAAPGAPPPGGAARLEGDCTERVTRGGSYDDKPQDLRAAARSWETVDARSQKIGFRVARALDP
jgi:formylglycine-generating enzyme required for sulfatase activity